MGNLSLHYHSSSSAAASPNPGSPADVARDEGCAAEGYLSDDAVHGTSSSNRRADRKKGVPWTEEEHRLFLIGLQKLGKGDWRGISRNYVTSRTPTQVASHAQKYFIRQCNATRRKRRSSLFDMVPEMQDESPMPEDHFMLPSARAQEDDDPTTFPSLKLSLSSEFEPMEAASDERPEEVKETTPARAPEDDDPTSFPSLKLSLSSEFEPMEATSDESLTQTQSVETATIVPTFFPAFLPVPFSLWPLNSAPIKEENENKSIDTSHHEVYRPIPVVPKEPVKVDELVGMSQLSIKENENRYIEPSYLSLNLLVGGPSRPSAFHANIPSNESDLCNDKGSSSVK